MGNIPAHACREDIAQNAPARAAAASAVAASAIGAEVNEAERKGWKSPWRSASAFRAGRGF